MSQFMTWEDRIGMFRQTVRERVEWLGLAIAFILRACRGWQPMTTTPKDGRTILLRIRHGWTYKMLAIPGCWMAPHGNAKLEGWWASGAITGTQSYDGLPHRYDATAVTPYGWMDLPIPCRSPRDWNKE
jgi:hypothetical protein